MTLAEKWMRQGRREGRKQGLEEGVAKGVAQGVAQGRLDGQRRLLEKQLRLKFGDLDPVTLSWLQSANEAALEVASERVLTATAVAELIAAEGSRPA